MRGWKGAICGLCATTATPGAVSGHLEAIRQMNCQQRTIAKTLDCSGIGIHSGKTVNLTIHPAPANHGIKFKRTDLQDCPSISTHFNMVVDTSLATVIGYNGFIISTIEHLMACFFGLGVDNALVEIDSYEMPIMDGSAGPFADLILEGGIVDLKAPRCFFVVKEPIELADGHKFVGLYPDSEMKITYAIDYPHPLIGKQTYSLNLTEKAFVEEISRARTFGFFEEYEQLKQFGLSRGGSLDNVVVVDRDRILNPGGLRFKDEFVRHKILDSIGDIALLGMPIIGHVVLSKSGHAFNHAFLRKFFDQKRCWETVQTSNLSDLMHAASRTQMH
jgi:UDP-3-O-[3-hydroxymyristoyl] N-acetylglucosamine deacetylase